MRKLKLTFTIITILTMTFAAALTVFAKALDMNDYHNWTFSAPGETVKLEGCESVEDEAKDWEYVKGTEHFYDASITVMDYFVDSNGDGTTTYEIIAHLDNSKHDTKKYNTWLSADGVIDLEKLDDVRNNPNNKVEYTKEKSKPDSKGIVEYHIIVTAPDDMNLCFYYNAGLEEKHKEVKLIGNLYNGLSNAINHDAALLLKLNPEDENPSTASGKKDESKSESSKKMPEISLRVFNITDKADISILEFDRNKKGIVKGSEKYFESSFQVTELTKVENDDGSVDFDITAKVSMKNHDKNLMKSFKAGLLRDSKLEEIKNTKDTYVRMKKVSDGDDAVLNFTVHLSKDVKDDVNFYFTTDVPKDFEYEYDLFELPTYLVRAVVEKDIYRLNLAKQKDYKSK